MLPSVTAPCFVGSISYLDVSERFPTEVLARDRYIICGRGSEIYVGSRRSKLFDTCGKEAEGRIRPATALPGT